jgi:hypothetical protein
VCKNFSFARLPLVFAQLRCLLAGRLHRLVGVYRNCRGARSLKVRLTLFWLTAYSTNCSCTSALTFKGNGIHDDDDDGSYSYYDDDGRVEVFRTFINKNKVAECNPILV